MINKAIAVIIIFNALSPAVGKKPIETVLVYRGTSDASTAIALIGDMFAVADDENNTLRVYKTQTGGPPIYSYDLTGFLNIEPEHPEADIEGATRIANRIYWITSHGRNKDGKIRPNRYRFFATAIEVKNGKVTIRPIGKPCKNLIHQLIKTESMRPLELDKATRFDENLTENERTKIAPKKQGLNIEALCASANGRTLYIGFRNPLPLNKNSRRPNALVVSLKNAAEVIEKSDEPIFGEFLLWDLAGLGIRSMEYSSHHKAYFIIAGPHDENPKFALYRWSGNRGEQPVLVRELNFENSNFTPEALIPLGNSARILLLSDDGSLPIKVSGPHECLEGRFREDGTCLNKFLLDSNRKTFRAIWLKP